MLGLRINQLISKSMLLLLARLMGIDAIYYGMSRSQKLASNWVSFSPDFAELMMFGDDRDEN